MAATKKKCARLSLEALEDRCLMSATPTAPRAVLNWVNTNLKDAGVKAMVRQLDSDSTMSRNDMLAVFQRVSQDGRVTANEFKDLKKLCASASLMRMPDYVASLSGKVVNGDAANAHYQGRNLGNLKAGSTGAQLNMLVSKWFLGSDRPATSYAYQRAAGVLFGGDGPVYEDVRQGYLGDCYLLASLGETAERAPEMIRSMFIDNGDQTWTVRYYVSGKASFVTVDRYVPTYGGGRFIFANMGDSVGNPREVLWVALAEKAYAQLNESGGLGRQAANSYASIEAGYISYAIRQIYGQDTYLGRSLDFNTVVNAWHSGELIGFASKSGNPPNNIVGCHAYALVGYNATNQTFTVFNPWGLNNGHDPGLITLTWSQMVASFSYWDSTK